MKKINLLITILLVSVFSEAQEVNFNDHWYNNGPNTAFVTAMEVAPSDSNIIYLGARNGLIYRSEDMGITWDPCATEGLLDYESYPPTTAFPVYENYGKYHATYNIIINPNNSQELYLIMYQNHCLRSTNGGNTWENYAANFGEEATIHSISFDPRDSNKALIYINNGEPPYSKGIYSTIDGGLNWNIIEDIEDFTTLHFSNLCRNPFFPDQIYAYLQFSSYKSEDNGQTWIEISNFFYSVKDLQFNPENEQDIWATTIDDFNQFVLVHSVDGGYTWTLTESFIETFTFFIDKLRNIYIQSYFDIFYSTDSGITFDTLPISGRDFGFDFISYTGLQNMYSDPTNENQVFMGNGMSINIINNETFEISESPINLKNAYIYDIEICPSNNDIVYAAGDPGLWKSEDRGLHWKKIANGVYREVKVTGVNADTLFVFPDYFHVLRSFDGGNSLKKLTGDTIPEKITIDHLNKIIYCVDNKTLYKSLDFGDSWIRLYNFWEYEIPAFVNIVIDPGDPNIIIYGKHQSTDGGENWDFDYFNYHVRAIDPQHSNIIYAGNSTGTQIYQSTNHGTSFYQIYNSGTLFNVSDEILNFKINPNDSNYIYFGTFRDGIIYSNDFGNTWEKLSGEYIDRACEIIPLKEEEAFYIATFGEGVWVYDSEYTGIQEDINYFPGNNELIVFPNPVKNIINLQTKFSGKGIVSMYNLQGKLVRQTEKKFTKDQPVEWKITDDANFLDQGVYFISLEIGSKRLNKKVIIE